MKLVEKYIHAVGQKLPLKGREDTKKELKSLILDEIEEKYGNNPTDEEIKNAVAAFGSPSKVAKKYSGNPVPISSGYSDLFFMVCGIMIFAMFVSYTTVFITGLFAEGYENLPEALLHIPLNIITSSLSGIGAVTIVFVIITRLAKENKIELDKDWTPDELNGIVLDNQPVSRKESIITICILAVLIIIMNIIPELITMAEDAFGYSQIPLGHSVNTDVFRYYMVFLSIIWSVEIVYNILMLKSGQKTKSLALVENIISVPEIIIFAGIILDFNLYLYDTGIIGFKIIFAIVLIVNVIETAVRITKLIIKRLAK